MSQNSTSAEATWDKSKFSVSVNEALENFPEATAVDILSFLKRRHYDYGVLYPAESETSVDLFSNALDQLGRHKLDAHPAGDWTNEVLGLLKVPSQPGVINGRLFTIGLLLSNDVHESSALEPDTTASLIRQLDAELRKEDNLDFKECLTTDGFVRLKAFPGVLDDPDANAAGSESSRNGKLPHSTLLSTATHSDAPSDDDSLSRKSLAEYLARRLRTIYHNDIHTAHLGSYFVQIDGAWGSGKSTLMRFMRKSLEAPYTPSPQEPETNTDEWIIVPFNAWENQRLNPPWWYLMNTVNSTIRKALRDRGKRSYAVKLWLQEAWWRIRTGKTHLFFIGLLTLIAAVAAYLYIADALADSAETTAGPDATNEKVSEAAKDLKQLLPAQIAAIITMFTALWPLTKYFRTSLAPGSGKAAQQFIEENGKDPMQVLSRHFKKQVERAGCPVAIFIDDLDRCNKDYGVHLLEGLQTIFKDAPVVYVVAADRRWLRSMYEQQYEKFAPAIERLAKPFGLVFLDKTFQLIIELPEISVPLKRIFWNRLLRINPKADQTGTEELKAVKEEVEAARTNEQKLEAIDKASGAAAQQAAREAAVATLSIGQQDEGTQEALARFVDLLEPNPRSMKRIINDVGTAHAISVLYNQDVTQDQLILWAILRQEHPALAEHFLENPDQISEVGKYNALPTGKPLLDAVLARDDVKRLFRYKPDKAGEVVLDAAFVKKLVFSEDR